MPVNYDRAVSRAPVFDCAPNRDFERVRWYVSSTSFPESQPKSEDIVRVTRISNLSIRGILTITVSFPYIRVIRQKFNL